MNRSLIEHRVKSLHAEIYRSAELLHSKYSGNPLELLEPQILAQVLGAYYSEQPGLSQQPFPYRGQRMETAGLMDRRSNRIVIDSNFSIVVRRFTGAHECGHWNMHPKERMHRDRPLDGNPTNHVRPLMEREADYFAATFLMPRRLVIQEFKSRFGTDQLVFNNTVSHQVCPERVDELLSAEPNSLVREKHLAGLNIVERNHRPSLSQLFRVSETAMAIRIRELNLVVWP